MAHRSLAEHGADVQDAKPADLQEIAEHVRATALEAIGADAEEFAGVVCDQPVAAAQKLKRKLALSDPALACQEHPEPHDLHEHAVQDLALGERTR